MVGFQIGNFILGHPGNSVVYFCWDNFKIIKWHRELWTYLLPNKLKKFLCACLKNNIYTENAGENMAFTD